MRTGVGNGGLASATEYVLAHYEGDGYGERREGVEDDRGVKYD